MDSNNFARFTDAIQGHLSIDGKKGKYFKTKDSSSPSGHSLLAQIEMTHSGIVTGNYGFYLPSRMKDGAPSFTNKFPKPVLIGHDEGEAETDPIGRVIDAEYVDTSAGYLSNDSYLNKLVSFRDEEKDKTLSFVNYIISNYNSKDDYAGLGNIRGTLNITDSKAIEKILDGRYLTVSISMISDSATCSICGTNWIKEGFCEHRRGQSYEDSVCVVIPGTMRYEHVAIVNSPADPNAHTFSIVTPDTTANAGASGGLNLPRASGIGALGGPQQVVVVNSTGEHKNDLEVAVDLFAYGKDSLILLSDEKDINLTGLKDKIQKVENAMSKNDKTLEQMIQDEMRVGVTVYRFATETQTSKEVSVSEYVEEFSEEEMMETINQIAAMVKEKAEDSTKITKEEIGIYIDNYFGEKFEKVEDSKDDKELFLDYIDDLDSLSEEDKKHKESQRSNLSDSAFAYIEPGGKKVDGKTTPDSKRHLPHHDESHLENALARVNQTKIPPAAKKRAEGHLRRDAKALGVGEDKDSVKIFYGDNLILDGEDKETKRKEKVSKELGETNKITDKEEVKLDDIKTNIEAIKALDSLELLSEEVAELAELKALYDSNDVFARNAFDWEDKEMTEIVSDYIDWADNQFSLSDYSSDDIYAEMSNYLPEDKVLSEDKIKELKSNTYCGKKGYFPVIDEEHAIAALKVLSYVDASDAIKGRILSAVHRRVDKLGIELTKKTFDSKNKICNNDSVLDQETLLQNYLNAKKILVDQDIALPDSVDTSKEVKDKEEEVDVLESQLEAANEEITELEEERDGLKTQLVTELATRNVDMKILSGDFKVEDRVKEIESHSTRTLDSLKDQIKDLEKAKNIENDGLAAIPTSTVDDPTLKVKDGTEKGGDQTETEDNKDNFNKYEIYDRYFLLASQKGKSAADKWLDKVQKKKGFVVSLD